MAEDSDPAIKETWERIRRSTELRRLHHYHPFRIFREGDGFVAKVKLTDDDEAVDDRDFYFDKFGMMRFEDALIHACDSFEIGVNHGTTRDFRKTMRGIKRK